MLTYAEARQLFATARDHGAGKPLENNTRLHVRFDAQGEHYAVRLHETDVVTIHPDGTYTLDSGGWRTSTTKARLNSYSPALVSQSRNQWWVATGKREGYPAPGPWATTAPFVDGMTVDANGLPVEPAPVSTVEAERAYHKLRRSFVKGWLKEVEDTGGLPEPDNGDCWYCLTFDSDLDNPDHILEHMSVEERYYVPSFLRDCIALAGYPQPDFVTFLIEEDCKRGRASFHVRQALNAFFRKHNHVLLPAFIAQYGAS